MDPIRIGWLGSALDGPGGGYDKIHRLAFDEATEQGLLDRPVEFVLHPENGLPQGSAKNATDGFRYLVDEGCIGVAGARPASRQHDRRRAARTRAAGPLDQLVRNGATPRRVLLPTRQRRLRRRRRACGRVAESQRLRPGRRAERDLAERRGVACRFFRQECRRRGISVATVETVSQTPDDLASHLDNLRPRRARGARLHGLRDARRQGPAPRGVEPA